LFNEARKNEETYNYEKALFYYCKAIEPIKNHISVIPEVDIEGRKAFIINEIISSVQNIFGKIILRLSNTRVNGIIGKPVKEPININIITLSPNGEMPLSNIPVSFSFVKGKGELEENAHSDSNGKVSCQVLLISGTEKEQIIKAELNLSNFLKLNDNSELSNILLSLFTPPSIMVFISVKSPLITIESHELILGNESQTTYIEPIVKKYLSNKGFIFVTDSSSVDYILTIQSDSRKGTETFGLFTSFIDFSFSVKKKDTGEEIYKTKISNLKGVGNDYEKASLNAYQDLSKKIEEIIQEVALRIFND
jgi:hypothetical protein